MSTNKDPALIGRIIAKYLLGWVVEQVLARLPCPRVVHPLGLPVVDKKSVKEPFHSPVQQLYTLRVPNRMLSTNLCCSRASFCCLVCVWLTPHPCKPQSCSLALAHSVDQQH
jgi:hypothetical protein